MIRTRDDLTGCLSDHRESLHLFFHRLAAEHEGVVSQSEFQHVYEAHLGSPDVGGLEGSSGDAVLRRVQEAVLAPSLVLLAVRERVARWRYVEVHAEVMGCRDIPVAEYLAAKERVFNELHHDDEEDYTLEIDLTPFERGFPKLEETDQIGRGVEFLNEYLCSRILEGSSRGEPHVAEFLRLHAIDGRPLLVNDHVMDPDDLRSALDRAIALLADDPPADWKREIARIGFEEGWGDSPERTAESMRLLTEVLDRPDPDNLAAFLDRIPMIFNIVIVSPHGFFGQANVLGKPDTGGQVVYILDQVRALEKAMRESIQEQGLDVHPNIIVLTRLLPEAGDTTCDRRTERIAGTLHARILRVPFRDPDGEVIPEWISRFDIWPYLERFAREAEREIVAELDGHRPDFVIGNYSDGNLVSTLLAERLGVTQCTIAHALEKTKYQESDLRWKALEDDYHFSCQFTADLIAMNTADFIITSTFQEIAGTPETVGQYESYQSFTLPELYRVVSGVDCFDPKFNIVSPGADADVFFPYDDRERRPAALVREVESLVFEQVPGVSTRGRLGDAEKPIALAMSRLDPVKNMSGLLRWYAESEELRARTNLLLVGGTLDPELSDDRDERSQIETMHRLMDEHDLDEQVRWIEMQTDRNTVGALYRLVADRKGAFVQPALFEAFGLTVIEAMSSGLPCFATCHGGPLEIIEHGVSGYHIDPTSPEEATRVLLDFFQRVEDDPEAWESLSKGAIARVEERYTWKLYAERLLQLSRIYGFWRHITSLERDETRRYLEMFYGLMYRPRAAVVAASLNGGPGATSD